MAHTVQEVIVNRKSARDFLPTPVEAEKMQAIYDAILLAPTTENMMMYTVISVKDPDVKAQLSKQPAIQRAPEVLVFCADYRRWVKLFDGMSEVARLPEEGEYQLSVIDATIAAQSAVLAAEGQGLNSVYLGDIMEHYEDRATALGLPLGVVPVLTLCVGYATEKQLARPATARYPQEMVIHQDTYHDFAREELLEMTRVRIKHEAIEKTLAWLTTFAKRTVAGKGALERTRSIRAAIASWQNITL